MRRYRPIVSDSRLQYGLDPFLKSSPPSVSIARFLFAQPSIDFIGSDVQEPARLRFYVFPLASSCSIDVMCVAMVAMMRLVLSIDGISDLAAL
jgi:hypothetical protein